MQILAKKHFLCNLMVKAFDCSTSVIMLTLHFHYQVQNGQEKGQECKDGKIVITARWKGSGGKPVIKTITCVCKSGHIETIIPFFDPLWKTTTAWIMIFLFKVKNETFYFLNFETCPNYLRSWFKKGPSIRGCHFLHLQLKLICMFRNAISIFMHAKMLRTWKSSLTYIYLLSFM